MPDYHDTPGYKPSDKEQQQKLQQEHENKQKDRLAAARNNLKNTEAPGPAERLAAKREELTPAQQAMKQKREEARRADLAELSKPHSDRVIGRLKPPDRDR